MKSQIVFSSLAAAAGLFLSPLVPSSLARDRPPSERSGLIVAHLDVDASMHEIGGTNYASRKELAKDLEARVKATHDALADINTTDLPPDMRSQYRAALDAEGDARTELNSRIKAARNADVDNWETNRAALGEAYQHYVDEATRAESLANSVSTAPATR